MLARFKRFGLTFFIAVALCLSMVGFSSVASAHTPGYDGGQSHHGKPKLECTPRTVYPRGDGNGLVSLNGKNYTPFGTVVIQPQNQPATFTQADARGDFSFLDVLYSYNTGRSLHIITIDETTAKGDSCKVYFV